MKNFVLSLEWYFGMTLRAAVRMEIEDIQEWLCLSCAKKLAAALRKAAKDCQKNVDDGLEYRYERWEKKRKKA